MFYKNLLTGFSISYVQGCQTRIQSDDFILDPLDIDNGCNQRDTTSIILYHFYNAGLIDVAKEIQAEIALAFINDVTFLAAGKNFLITHAKIHSMMTRPNSAYEWSREHNTFLDWTSYS